MKKRALISVSDKVHLLPFCKQLLTFDFEIISTGGTKKYLEENQMPVIGISDITHFPEILDGRVKTLHPHIHAALLCNRDIPEHVATLASLHIEWIDLLVVNLYPFQATIQKPNVQFEDAIEQIDIGGPAMLRSAAKNFKHLTVIVNPEDYDVVIEDRKKNGEFSLSLKQLLATKVFLHTAQYDSIIANYLKEQTENALQQNPLFSNRPEDIERVKQSLTTPLVLSYSKKSDLRYGENPHQQASLFMGNASSPYSVVSAKQLHGKELSYNNIQDANAALQIASEFHGDIVCVGIKHANPCGVGVGKTVLEAWMKMFYSDTISIFGGIVACNQSIDETLANAMKDVFLEVILAPDFSPAALTILQEKKNLRILQVNMTTTAGIDHKQIVSLNGGLLMQDADKGMLDQCTLECVTKKQPTPQQIDDLKFAWKVVKHVKSNAIVVAQNSQTLGVGAGQMNRIGSAKIALEQAKNNTQIQYDKQGLVLASDAFFPFDDVVQMAKDYHVSAIIQPGGSIKDAASIKACDDHQIAMLFTGMRHFKH